MQVVATGKPAHWLRQTWGLHNAAPGILEGVLAMRNLDDFLAWCRDWEVQVSEVGPPPQTDTSKPPEG